MNKWQAFDDIKTPEEWKNIPLTQHKSHHFRLVYIVLIMIMVFSSIGIIYACYDDFQLWVDSLFHKSTEYIIKEENEKWGSEDVFLYSYQEVREQIDVQDVYILTGDQYQKLEPQHKKGKFENQDYSFSYVLKDNKIFVYNCSGFIDYCYNLNLVIDQCFYFMSSDHNLCTYHLKTGEIQKLTNDYISSNPCMSPNGTYILINKQDVCWSVYHTQNHTETIVDGLAGYVLSNEKLFISDYQLLSYSDKEEMMYTCLFDLKDSTYVCFNEYTASPFPSTFRIEKKADKTIITDIATQETKQIDRQLNDNYVVLNNRYIVSDNENNNFFIYDFMTNQYFDLNYENMKENIGIALVDDSHLLIHNDQEYVVIDLKDYFK